MNTLRSRFNIWVFLLILFIFGHVFFFIRDIQIDSIEQIEATTTQLSDDFLRESWQKNVHSMTDIFAEQLVRPLYVKDLHTVQDLALVIVSQDFVTRVLVMDERGMILSDGTEEATRLGTFFDQSEWEPSENDYLAHSDIAIGSASLGTLIVGYDSSQPQRLASAMHERTRSHFREMEHNTQIKLTVLFALALVVGMVAAYILSRGLISPLEHLSEAIKRIGRRDYDISLPFTRTDELGRLGRTLEDVAASLRTSTVSRRYLENVLGSLPVGVAITDLRGNIINANLRFNQFFPRRGQHTSLPLALDMDEDDFTQMIAPLQRGEYLKDLEIVLEDANEVRDALISGVRLGDPSSGEPPQYLFIVHDITERKGLERKLRHIASHDALTGLPNRRYIFHNVEKQIMQFRRDPDSIFWVLFVDLDGFKQINDRHGHHVGDEVLKTVARRLLHISREEDLVARLSGDEFLVLLKPHLTAEVAAGVAQRILEAVEQPITIGDLGLNISASLGLACCDDENCDAESLIIRADSAMYEAKMQGKGRIVTAGSPHAEAGQPRAS